MSADRYLENIQSVPENIRTFVCRTILIGDMTKLYHAIDQFNSSAISYGYNISKFTNQMKASLGSASDAIVEHEEEKAA